MAIKRFRSNALADFMLAADELQLMRLADVLRQAEGKDYDKVCREIADVLDLDQTWRQRFLYKCHRDFPVRIEHLQEPRYAQSDSKTKTDPDRSGTGVERTLRDYPNEDFGAT